MNRFMVTVDVRGRRWWIMGLLQNVGVQASSHDMALKRAMRMARQALPRRYRIHEVQVRMVAQGPVPKPVKPAAVSGPADLPARAS